MTLAKAQLKSIVITPMLTGSISSVASLAIIISILRSEVKLSNSYRRLVFGISVYDLIQSIGQAFSSVLMPSGTFWLASGNDVSCKFQGFITIVGFVGTIFYSLSLTIFFLLVIKYNLNDAKIAKYAEPWLHGVPIVYSSLFSIYAAATNNYNVDGAMCGINSVPLGCYDNPDLECDSVGDPGTLKWISGGPIFFIFASNCIMMFMIFWAVHFQVKKSIAYRYSWMISSRGGGGGGGGEEEESTPHGDHHQQHQQQEQKVAGNRNCWKLRFFGCILSNQAEKQHQKHQQQQNRQQNSGGSSLLSSSPLAARLSRPSQASIRRLKETSNRAIAYIVGFLLVYTFSIIFRLHATYSSSPTPFAIIILARFFFPLQG